MDITHWIPSRGQLLAVSVAAGSTPTVMFLPGFASDMTGTKAAHLAAWCAQRGVGCVRFDYSGHGASQGVFTDGTIGQWRDDALAVIDAATRGDLLLVGSSMGGWIGLLAALARPSRVIGFVGLAAAADFTQALMWPAMTPPQRHMLQTHGVLDVPSEYGAPLRITRRLIDEGRDHLLLGAAIPLACPIRLIHGQRDQDVPWQHSLALAGRLASEDITITVIKDGEHRLSRPQDLAVLEQALSALLGGGYGG